MLWMELAPRTPRRWIGILELIDGQYLSAVCCVQCVVDIVQCVVDSVQCAVFSLVFSVLCLECFIHISLQIYVLYCAF